MLVGKDGKKLNNDSGTFMDYNQEGHQLLR